MDQPVDGLEQFVLREVHGFKEIRVRGSLEKSIPRRGWRVDAGGSAKQVEGRVKTALPNTTRRVGLDMGGEVLAHIGGQMRKHSIKIIPGDRVKVEVSLYDLARGRVTFRIRN